MGKIICAGLGPGDPSLMSVKADQTIRLATQIAYFRKRGQPGRARTIVSELLAPGVTEYPMEYPVTTELPVDSLEYQVKLSAFYEHWTTTLLNISKTENVAVLCEGDPFFYGSFMHLYVRLKNYVSIEVIPGIPGMTGCWGAIGQPLTWGDDVLSVVMGTLPEDKLTRHIAQADALVVMKIGRHLAKVRQALATTGRSKEAWLVTYGTMAQESIVRLQDFGETRCPYFSLVVVHGHGRRPQWPGGEAI
ncbi:MAG: precorrin-2 C(20)-methyltransferase [Myxococcales bacterium]|nr:precorrin-2 C(20)-methyltransferase [Myxococcales bacterium]